MATREEVKSALAKRLNKYKVQTPTRIAYLGDGRGQATSNIVPPGEPDKFWARESLNGEKPFKVLNRNPNFTPAFNLPILLGYPEDDPDTEQVMGIHRGLVQFSTGNAGSAIGGVAPHHIKHEWGGGDEVFVDPRMFKPGLVKPTAPTSMAVKVLSFEHYYNTWCRYDGGTTEDLAQYRPSSDYRYVLITLDPDSNQIRTRPGVIFTPDLSIDSIISNQAQNTFRHIPAPPGNEIPLGVVLLEPSTTKIDWNVNGVNNLMPMRLLLGSSMREINERLTFLEAATGVGSLPMTGAANSIQADMLPGLIDGNVTRMVLNRSSSSPLLPTLLVGELAYVNDSPSMIIVGTPSGNHVFNAGGGGGATTLGDLDDVNISTINNQYLLKYDSATSRWIGGSAISIGNNPSGVYFNYPASLIGITAALRIDDTNGVPLIQTGTGVVIDSVGDGNPINLRTPNGVAMYIGGANGDSNEIVVNPDSGGARLYALDDNNQMMFEFDPSVGFRIATADSPSAVFANYSASQIVMSSSANASMMVMDVNLNAVQFGTSVAGQIADFRSHQILFNKNNSAMPVLIGASDIDTANGETALFQVGAPVDSNAFVAKMNGRLLMTRYGSGTLGTNVSYQPDTTDGNQLAVLGAATSTTGVGGGAVTALGQIRALFSTHDHPTRAMAWTFYTSQAGAATERMRIATGVQIGAPTGGDKGAGTINAAGDIYKNNTAYTSPDYALEYWATGKVERYKDNDGAIGYYRLPIEESRQYVKKNLHLPRISREPAGIFERSDMVLEKIEEAHIYIYELHDKIKELEARLVKLENK